MKSFPCGTCQGMGTQSLASAKGLDYDGYAIPEEVQVFRCDICDDWATGPEHELAIIRAIRPQVLAALDAASPEDKPKIQTYLDMLAKAEDNRQGVK